MENREIKNSAKHDLKYDRKYDRKYHRKYDRKYFYCRDCAKHLSKNSLICTGSAPTMESEGT